MAFFVIPIALPAVSSVEERRSAGAKNRRRKTLIACASLAVPEKRLENFPPERYAQVIIRSGTWAPFATVSCKREDAATAQPER